MSKLDELMAKFCPNGVEYKELGEICQSIKDGMHNLPKSSRKFGDYPILSVQNIYNNLIDYHNAKRFVDKKTFIQENKRTNVEVGDVLLTIVATIGRSAVVKIFCQNSP
ncbi:MAG: restriction endonuclease subunit S [Selenomonadaceae bacterium]|nr:restriction endonuclease subunit S [Selenomonadaceae bacterium]